MDHLLTQQRVKCGPLIDPTVPQFFKNLIFTTATSKMKVRNSTTGSFFGATSRAHFLPPKSGTIPNSLRGTHSNTNFLFALCFPYLGLIGVLFWRNSKLIESQVGQPMVQFLAFSNLGVSFSNMTWFDFIIWPLFCSLVFFHSSMLSFILSCFVCVIMLPRNTQKKGEKRERKK